MDTLNKKIIRLVFISILIISLIINLHYLNKSRQINTIIENSMSNHEGLFGGMLSSAERNGDYSHVIQDLNQVSLYIDDLKQSLMYYQMASALSMDNSKSYFQSKHLMDLYVYALEGYRNKMTNGDVESYEYDINVVFEDLNTIGDWMNEKLMNKDYHVYSDNEFYKEVYSHLKSEVVKESMFFK